MCTSNLGIVALCSLLGLASGFFVGLLVVATLALLPS